MEKCIIINSDNSDTVLEANNLYKLGWITKYVVPFRPTAGGETSHSHNGKILLILEKNDKS